MRIRLGTLRRLIEAGLPPVKKIPAGVHGAEYLRRQTDGKIASTLGPGFDRHPTFARPGSTMGLGSASNDEVDDDTWEDGHDISVGNGKTRKAYSYGQQPDGDTFEEIAKELGMSIAGAKNAVDNAIDKARFIGNIDDDDREILVLTAMVDYVKYLVKSGEVSPEEAQLMKSRPDIVGELDGFREFLNNHIRRARRTDTKVEY